MPLALFLALPLLAAAPDAAPVCPATPGPLAGAMAGWTQGKAIVAGSGEQVFPFLALGKRAEVTLADNAKVRFVAPPEKPGEAGSRGGLLAFKVERAGLYRVAIGTGAWIDVLAGGKPLASVAHDHGAACSGIRKTVDFRLAPGPHLLQISGSKDATASVMVTLLP